MTDHRAARNNAGEKRLIRMIRTDETRTVSYREAVGLVSRGLAAFEQDVPAPEPKAKAPAKKAAAKKAPAKKQAEAAETAIFAEKVFADPTSPLTPTDLPGPASGDAADDGENKPLDLL